MASGAAAVEAEVEADSKKAIHKMVRLGAAEESGVPAMPAIPGSDDGNVKEEKSRHSDSELDEMAGLEGDSAPENSFAGRPPERRISSFAKTATVVPRSERRGLFGRFSVIPEIETPYEYTNRTKWLITAVVALAAAASPMGSGIFYRKPFVAPLSHHLRSMAYLLCHSCAPGDVS